MSKVFAAAASTATESAFHVLMSQPIALRTIDGETEISSAALLALDALETAANTWAKDTPAAMGIVAMLQSVVPCHSTWLAQIHLLRRTVDLWTTRACG